MTTDAIRLLDENNAGWSCGENKRALVLRGQLNGSPLRTQGTDVVVNAELKALLSPLRMFFAGDKEAPLHRKTRTGTRSSPVVSLLCMTSLHSAIGNRP
jgi:hypothetical protein